MDKNNGRFAILWPHGILFRDAEAEMRRKMVASDHIEAVIGLGPNLFYNSPMEAMILVGNTSKPANRKGKVLFVNGKDDVVVDKGQAYLTNLHINKLYQAFVDFTDIPHYAKVATTEEILALNGNMNINFYVKKDNSGNNISFSEVFSNWQKASNELKKSMQTLFEELN